MVYMYTQAGCGECEKKKQQFKSNFVRYIEREASRLVEPQDKVDVEASVQAATRNSKLPVMVEFDVIDTDECVS